MPITLDQALHVLVGWMNNADGVVSPKLPEAIGLGIEAMKREMNYRMAHPDVAPYLLPGETEE